MLSLRTKRQILAWALQRTRLEGAMKRFCVTIALALTGVMTIGAQDQKIETKTKTRIDVASGDTMVLTGCVRPYGTGAYMLTNVSSKN
jgi:hypothetical protein